MAATDQLSKALPYLERLLDDDAVHQSLGEAVSRTRAGYRRASKRRASEAVADKRLYEQVRTAVASLRDAVAAVQGQPKPKPRRRVRRLVLIGILGGTVAAMASQAVRGRVKTLLGGRASREAPVQLPETGTTGAEPL